MSPIRFYFAVSRFSVFSAFLAFAFVRVPFYARNARYRFEPFFLRAAIKATTVIYVHTDVKSPTRIRLSFFSSTGLRAVSRFITRYKKNQDAL